MRYLRRNLLPLAVGIAAALVAVAAVVVIVDRVRDDDEPQRLLRIGGAEIDLDELERALEDFDLDDLDLDDLDDLEEVLEALGLGDLGGLRALTEALSPGGLGELLRERLGGRLGETGLRAGSVLGVTVDDDGNELVVRRVLPGTPAARAGVEAGDQIVSVADERVDDLEELRGALAAIEPGHDYELIVRRDGERLALEVERRAFVLAGVGEALRGFFGGGFDRFSAPAPPEGLPEARAAQPPGGRRFSQPQPQAAAPRLGITAADSDDGARIASVLPGTGAAAAGLRPGDLVLAVADARVGTVDELRAAIARFQPGDAVAVTVLRDGAREVLRVRLTSAAEPFGQSRPPGGFFEGFEGATERFRGGERFPGERFPGGRFRGEPSDARPFDDGAPRGSRLPDSRPALEPDAAVLDRLADLVAERLAARGEAGAPPPERAAEPGANIAPPGGLVAYFGTVVAIDDGSITLTGTQGAITLALTADTARVGFKDAAAGDLATVVSRDGVVQLLIVVG